MFIKPAAAGLKIRDPITKMHLPAEGAEVSFSSPKALNYWIRRMRSGEVIECPPPISTPAEAPEQEPVASDS